ncbi:group II intron reverse transcriptase/maturase [Streptomyces chiangmaiensis]|uniref:Group II intron reverse transcriptase/maturase n=1 Tax=Streptomyces chiangmaiensis TaxID=766497 RepID=A0ABU7FX30_9ACTN|nr:group II intron reverse transcriptase/maturase [Streptomyces chiangmaiensis]MED7828472.1 group II intron reverse transcriptase/maturase [Streptomyces chiangmaiensis]
MPEPKDKLDAMVNVQAQADADEMANGPEGDVLEWRDINWRAAEDEVRRLRQRIFTASREGDLKRVRNLQKLMLRSRANTLLSVRRVTEINTGRKTAGVDGRTALLPQSKVMLVDWAQFRAKTWTPLPVKRVHIPKAGGKKRPLRIPVIADRVLQARVVNALEPEWEARFEPKSYGFRPGRGCHDAISAIYLTLKGKNPQRMWVLDADLKAAFDRIDHEYLLAQLGAFPARELVRHWLKAGVVDRGRLAPTEEGTPQGGVVSPLLLNIALHGMEQAAGVRYRKLGTNAAESVEGAPALIRYADDLVALCHSYDEAAKVKAKLAEWLRPRGLAFNEDKTRIVHADSGFDFLGFNVRRYDGKLLIKPSPAALRRIRERLRTEMKALRGANVSAVLHKIDPIVRGWSAYYRTVVSSKAFTALDDYMWKLTYKWAKHGHQNKSRNWIVNRYFGQFNKSSRNQWVFGDRETGAHLRKFSWTKIVRHQMVPGTSSPDDPALVDYWAKRRRKGMPTSLDAFGMRLLTLQDGRCQLCGGLLLYADHQPQSPAEWEKWMAVIRRAVTKQHIVLVPGQGRSDVVLRLVHTSCRRRRNADIPAGLASLRAREPSGLA